MENSTFESLALDPMILSALNAAGYKNPTEIQRQAIPIAIEGSDLMATAQTGTGKTAAFALPLLQQLLNASKQQEDAPRRSGNDRHFTRPRPQIKGLILSPTRELAQQIESNLVTYGKNLPFRVTSVVGGLPIQRQIRTLKRGVDILVATPGRLLDLMNRRIVRLQDVNFFVLDEADRMLDMGFVEDVQEIAEALKAERQTLLFSATTSPDVVKLSKVLLRDPKKVSVDRPQSAAVNIDQRVLFVDRGDKRQLLVELLSHKSVKRTLIFTTTKSNANTLAMTLGKKGIRADAIHSDKNQRQRQKALRAFADGQVNVLVATDVMARGIDVDGISHVINFELPREPESFVHRTGRTARAGTKGVALSFCDREELGLLRAIEGFTKQELTVDSSHSFHSEAVQAAKNQRSSGRRPSNGRGGRSGGRWNNGGGRNRRPSGGGGGFKRRRAS